MARSKKSSKTTTASKRTKTTPKAISAAKPAKKLPRHKADSPVSSEVIERRTPMRRVDRLVERLQGQRTGRIFFVCCLAILMATSILWSVLGARLQQGNADQLIDTYLFGSSRTFQEATFPGAHSFLLKWPIFAAMHLFGTAQAVFVTTTVLVVLLTITLFVVVLSRIERRPVVLGLFCLALASILLLVPAQPYAGALLPTNLAMLTTRNLEYVLYLTAMLALIRVERLLSWWSAVVVGLLGLLIASDKLFAVLAVGGVLLVVIWNAWHDRRRIYQSVVWLGVVMASFLLATVALSIINHLGITNIGSEGATSPYPLIHSLQQLGLGVIFGGLALLTNFGANPVHATTIIREIPGQVASSMHHISIFAYVTNAALLLIALGAAIYVFIHRPRPDETEAAAPSWQLATVPAIYLAVLLIGSTLMAGLVFVITDHSYAVDARYLTIGLFAAGIAGAVCLRHRQLPGRIVAAAVVVFAVSIPLGILRTGQEYHLGEFAAAGRQYMIDRVADEVARNHIDRLIGNYWDVTPVKGAESRLAANVTIAPVDRCNLARNVLTSKAWYQLPRTTPTAYLAIKDGSAVAGPDGTTAIPNVTTYGGCSLARIVSIYGVPKQRVILDKQTAAVGSPAAQTPQTPASSDIATTIPKQTEEQTPDALLLVYPDGIKQTDDTPKPAGWKARRAHDHPTQAPSLRTFAPLSENGVCPNGVTMQVVAHQDDDLLFMNPDVSTDIKAGQCMRTVYVTAGDAGEQYEYWHAREQGAEAAYAQMFGVSNSWYVEKQNLDGHAVTVAYLTDAPRVSLVFMRLPDGNMRGTGFPGHDQQSLTKLLDAAAQRVQTVDDSTSYTTDQLVSALHQIMTTDNPSVIRTQGSPDLADGDHADHHAVGIVTDRAASDYTVKHTVVHYLGYPDKLLPINLNEDEVTAKRLTFLTYASHDGAVCQTESECNESYTYGNYLLRKYQVPDQKP